MEAENRVWPPATRPNVLSLSTDTEVHATEGAADATHMYYHSVIATRLPRLAMSYPIITFLL